MTNHFSHVTTDEVARDIATALGPRRPCIEVVDPVMAQVLRAKTEWERLEIAAGMWRSARRLLQATIQQQYPEWTTFEVDREAARRMSSRQLFLRSNEMSIYATIELSESGHQRLPREFDPKNEGLMYGRNLPAMSDELDALAKELGVRPISAFLDDSDMIDDEEREELGLPLAKPKWEPVEDGLRTIRALIAAMTADGRGDDELWDLRVSERILTTAKSGETFRYNVL